MRILQHISCLFSVVAALLVLCQPAMGQEEEAESFVDALIGGTPSLNSRLRYEYGSLEGAESSDAVTIRTRLGYSTLGYKGFQGFVEFEDISVIGDSDDYNQAGTNPSASNRTVIADVESTELNQAFLAYKGFDSQAKVGRQRIIRGNARFVGNVGWRQNEQTYDAISFANSGIDGIGLYYAYLDNVYRIFGQENGTEPSGAAPNAAEYESDSHLVNVSWNPCPAFDATAYAYLLDLGEGAVGGANSSDTYGLNAVIKRSKEDGISTACELEYARQSDNSATTEGVAYDADYYKVDVNAAASGLSLGAGYEVLGSDDGASFRTPLATGHKFNGWADMFLVTPADGLEDAYLYASAKCPFDIGGTLKVVYHSFESDEGSTDYGEEIDVVAIKKPGKNTTLIAKYADFNADGDADNPKASDMERFSIEANFAF
jgi:hypothetical protein